jgi:hypothetical protein
VAHEIKFDIALSWPIPASTVAMRKVYELSSDVYVVVSNPTDRGWFAPAAKILRKPNT